VLLAREVLFVLTKVPQQTKLSYSKFIKLNKSSYNLWSLQAFYTAWHYRKPCANAYYEMDKGAGVCSGLAQGIFAVQSEN
jgi:hypothetical protein